MRGSVLLPVIAELASGTAFALSPEQIFDKVKDSIYVVKAYDSELQNIGLGSGVLLPSGDIATNCHVVEKASFVGVAQGEKLTVAHVFAANEDKDICLLEATGLTGKPANLGNSSTLKVGQRVYAIGAPEGLELSLSEGLVSQRRGAVIQTTAAISPGSSGGGLFDSNARLVGFTTLTHRTGQNLNFAIPVEWLAYAKPFKRGIPGEPREAAPAISPPDKVPDVARQPLPPPRSKQSEPRVDPEKSPLPQETKELLIAGYQQRMQYKILSYMRLPPGIEGNPEAVCLVSLLSNGEVARVTMTKSSGYPAYDAEVERAILKASPLPMPKDRQLASEFMVGITMKFRPFLSGGPTQSTSPIDSSNSPPAYTPDNPSLTYPIKAWAGHIQGKAILRVEVLPDGKPGRMWLKQSSGSGVLDRDAQSQIALWRFIPARKDGHPVTAWIDVPVVYRLNESNK